jgi:hypothetical protein
MALFIWIVKEKNQVFFRIYSYKTKDLIREIDLAMSEENQIINRELRPLFIL